MANDATCCNCASPVGNAVKVQPTRVTPADDPNGVVEVWCPRCFVWHRMLLEPERFNASHTCAARCQICGWVMVCPGADGQGLYCSHCGRSGAIMLRPTEKELDMIAHAVRAAVEETNAKL